MSIKEEVSHSLTCSRDELIQRAHEAEAKELAKSREALAAHLARRKPEKS